MRLPHAAEAWANVAGRSDPLIGITTQVRGLLEEIFAAPLPHDDYDLLDGGLLNSLSLARLLAALERGFGVEVADSDLVTANFRSVTAVAHLVQDKRAAGDGGIATIEEPAAEVAWGDAEVSIGRRFLDVAAMHPDAPAIAGAYPTSYAALALRARRIASGIAARTGNPGARVGVVLSEPEQAIPAILGTLLTGRVYVPIDPSFPRARIAAMLDDAVPELVIANEAMGASLPMPFVTPVELEDAVPLAPEAAFEDPDAVLSLLYTSGSSGRAKGVLQNHRNVSFHVRYLSRRFAIGSRDRHSLLASLSFDASTTDLFCALLNGAAVVPLDLRHSGFAAVARELVDRGVTLYHSTPTVFRHLVGLLPESAAVSALRLVILGGEPVTSRDFDCFRRRLPRRCVFANGYGATETSGFAALYEVTAEDSPETGVLPVGWAPEGIELAIRDRERPDVELSEGEIAVTSRHVALGYADGGHEEAARFVDDPARPGFRTYWTGDVGRRLADGAVVLAGRHDRQVKVRGFRVEPAEVEAALTEVGGVALAAVVACPSSEGTDSRLVGVVEPAPGSSLEAAEVRRQVAEKLPEYMVPGRIEVVEKLPLTPTGKVDAGAVERSVSRRRVPRIAFSGDGTAGLVAAIWADFLDAEGIGPDDNFFDLGGDSLLLARVHERLRSDLSAELPLHRLFEHPTVRSLAAYLDGRGSGSEPALQDARLRVELRRGARARRRAGAK